MLLPLLLFALPRFARAFFIYTAGFSGPAMHENITREGLGFLKFDVRESAVTGVWYRDWETSPIGPEQDDAKYHFDNCRFRETILDRNAGYGSQIATFNQWYAAFGNSANPASHATDHSYGGRSLYEPGGGGSLQALFGADTDAVYSVMGQMGLGLHAIQDLYSHSNWVELSQQGLLQERLYETGLGYWAVPSEWSIHPKQSNLVIAEGSASTLPAGWAVNYGIGRWDETPQGKTMGITAGGQIKYGLVTGRYDDDGTLLSDAFVHWNHYDDKKGDSAKYGVNYGLNKDRQDRLGFPEAAEFAVLQTAHEWERLVNLVATTYGIPQANLLRRIMVDFKTVIYVDRSFDAPKSRYDVDVSNSASTEQRDAFLVPQGTSAAPFRYLPVAMNAADPAGATMFIAPNIYIGCERLGKPGEPVRLVRNGTTGVVRLVK